MSVMPSPQTHSHGSIVEPCKLTLIFSLCLLTLPPLFFSLITFSILAFFLLLPAAFALSIIYFLSSILSWFPINSFLDDIYTLKVVPIEDQEPESIDLDDSEVPSLDESSSSSSTSSTEEQEKIMKDLEMDHEQFCRIIQRFGSVQTDGFMNFYEVLSFWRSMESTGRGKCHMD